MLLLLIALAHSPCRAETIAWFQPWTDVSKLVYILAKVPEGRAAIERARKIDPAFEKRIAAGAASYTQRDFTASNQPASTEPFGVSARILLRRGSHLSEAVADLAHELVHFADRRPPDPYGSGFNVAKFVRDGIEGEGSELKAFANECRTAWALEKEYPAFPKHEVCERYRKSGTFDTEAARLDYYAVGKARDSLPLALRTGIPELNDKTVVFKAGVDGKAYPESLSAEFNRTLKNLCSLARWRRDALEANAKARKSSAKEEYPRQMAAIEDFDRRRCK